MYTKTDYTRTKYGQYKDDNSKILTMPNYYITQDPFFVDTMIMLAIFISLCNKESFRFFLINFQASLKI